jgi:hypothetical protein
MTDKREPILVEKLFPPSMSKSQAIRQALARANVARTEYLGESRPDEGQLHEIWEQLEEFLEFSNQLDPDRSKGERIVSQCLQNDEPFFVFRARDIFTIMVLKQYIKLVEDYGPDDPDFQSTIIDFINDLKGWQRNNVSQVRYPD